MAPRIRILARAFSLLELLVSITLLMILIGLVMQISDQTSRVWRSSMAKIQSFQEARAGFEAMTRNLSRAVLNIYYDYYDSSVPPVRRTAQNSATFTPGRYDRASELHFISGQADSLLTGTGIQTQTHAVFFQAPMGYTVQYPGMNEALNSCGYFVQFGTDGQYLPPHVHSQRWRYRLMEMTQSTEELDIYNPGILDPFGAAGRKWFADHAATSSRVIAENVIALVLLPKLSAHDDDPSSPPNFGTSLAPNYNYDSRIPIGTQTHPSLPSFPGDSFEVSSKSKGSYGASRHHQLPPIMQVTMVVIDESSAARLHGKTEDAPQIVPDGLFENARDLKQDLLELEKICNAEPGNQANNTQRLTYRVFSTEILMHGAKWSMD